ncbi:class I SAM-dependent DNA methyltransferase [Pseudophaeobacter flagellatus]|uniref:class I SAM-dependent DNA methyltransferase n=1 Tax=Pseudophaeobacter flagellatus TaxID=2899119 RepID=UPI001E559A84|nr:class I SAM-dependent methyltransferase [Pseudophaeobacter flagellatus]MCD9149405.1 class I SAM-dependent methyltransferase [Pseudophaeobacter flagellatus]
MSDPETLQVYDTRAADYAARNRDHLLQDPRLQSFIAACPAGGRVLDLGCGPGTSAQVMAKAGLQADAMDASGEMVALTNAQDGVTAWQATFCDLAQDAIYDGVWANFSLLHAPRQDLPLHLAAIKRSLKPKGAFYIALKLGKGEARDTLGRLYTYYEEDELKNLLKTAGFTVLDCSYGKGKGLDGKMARWISVATHG